MEGILEEMQMRIKRLERWHTINTVKSNIFWEIVLLLNHLNYSYLDIQS